MAAPLLFSRASSSVSLQPKEAGRIWNRTTTKMTDSTPIPMFLTAEGINQRIRPCHPITLRRALKAGRIKGTLHSNKFYYDVASVIAWMETSVPIKRQRPMAGLVKRRRGRPRRKAVAK
jgi:hypothetical protein